MTQELDAIPAYRSFPITLFSQFELSVGLIDLPVEHTISTPPIVHVLHCAFSVVSYILLLNLLIAMMSDTHWRVAQERDELWRTQVRVAVKEHICAEGEANHHPNAKQTNKKKSCALLHNNVVCFVVMVTTAQVVATTLMLERRLPRCLWPRLGMCGLSYGLTERWYLR